MIMKINKVYVVRDQHGIIGVYSNDHAASIVEHYHKSAYTNLQDAVYENGIFIGLLDANVPYNS